MLMILICLFVYFEAKSDVLEDLSKTMNVSRLEYSLDKLIPDLKFKVFDGNFDDDRRYKYHEKRCNIGISKIDFNEYKTDKEMIVIGCEIFIQAQSMYNGEQLSNEDISRNFKLLVDERMELYADKIAQSMFYLLGNYGNHINISIFLSKFSNQYNLSKF